MRKAFINTLLTQAKKDSRIILLTGDLGFTVFEEFAHTLPKQFLNVGVAEQNLVGIATGLALTGKIPVCYSIASFLTTRCYEHIKIGPGAHTLPVILVGTGAGLSYSTASITHHALDDIALMRLVPNMTILSPADNFQTSWATKTALESKTPVYLRLSKDEQPDIHHTNDRLILGKGYVRTRGKKVALLSGGTMTHIAHAVQQHLERNHIHPTLVDIHTLKPLDTQLIKHLAHTHDILVTMEEHGIIGGLGSAVEEVIGTYVHHTKILKIGTPNTFVYEIGSIEYIRSQIGLSPSKIAKKIINSIKV